MSTAKERRTWVVVAAIVILVLIVFVAWFNTSWHYETLGPVVTSGPYRFSTMRFLYDLSSPERPLVGFRGRDAAGVQWTLAIHQPDNWPDPLSIEMFDGESDVYTLDTQQVYRVYPFGIKTEVGMKKVYTLYMPNGKIGDHTFFMEPLNGIREVGTVTPLDYLD